jgi:hypothetical protein
MAVVIPVLSIIGGVSAGMAMAATGVATLAGALAVGGAMMSGIGLLGKSDDALKIGGFLSMAGGLAGALGGGATAAAEGAGLGDSMQGFGDSIMEGAKADAGFGFGGNGLTQPPPLGQIGQNLGTELAAGAGLAQPPASGLTMANAAKPPPTTLEQSLAGLGQSKPAMSTLEQAASKLTQQDLRNVQAKIDQNKSIWDRTFGENMDAVGEWTRKNKELVNIGANALAHAYPQKPWQADQLDFQRSIYDRAQKNLNTPIRMKYTPGG